ncbi:MAG: BON domain-containing protein [Thermoanaerobaculia bacterium]|nr:BON domain-containing protein [Thermoanaerobaculia bacterium]
MKKPLLSALSITASLVLAVTACRPSQTVERQTKDAGIKATIKTRLATEVGASTITAVEVNVTNGAVTLAGPVGTETDRQRIEEVSRAVEGVVSVSNNLQVMTTQVVTPAMVETPAAPLPTTPPR